MDIHALARQAWQDQQMSGQRLSTSLAAADAAAVSEAGDYEAAANRESAQATNSLAARLATARRAPGGGIRLGMRRKGFAANNAGVGLNRANAAGRLERRKNELRTAATAAHAQDSRNTPADPASFTAVTLGPIVGQRYY
jgi:hypothetical protein